MICPPEYKPSISRLRQSLRLRCKEYFRENSLHGVPYFVDPTRPIIERVIWFIFTIASIITAFGVIAIVWNKFQTEPMLTGLDTQSDHMDVYFPNVYLCLNWNGLDASRLSQKEKEHYKAIYEWNWKPLNVSLNYDAPQGGYRKLFYRLGPTCSTIYSNCTFGGSDAKCEDLFKKVLTAAGVCCHFSAKLLQKVYSSWSLTFETGYYPVRVYIAETSIGPPVREDEPTYVFTNPAEMHLTLRTTQTTTMARFLTHSQRKCIFDDEGPTFNECQLECSVRKIDAKCQCLPWFLTSEPEKECPFKKYSCLSYDKMTLRRPKCSCLLSCQHTSYDFSKVKEKKESESCDIIIPNWPTVQYVRQVRFGWLDLVVSFGGVAGLFVGYSLLTSVELIYYFTLRAYCGAVLAVPKARVNVIKVKVRNPKPDNKKKTEFIQRYYDYVE
ncbi:sodium channel protein Nach-like [Orussus abietinus]|uniref:sodium channel protein Nach-like n=1 Tax=Orussus abietinus TaxID=222816 RepID=UPI00062583E9|nr:sodium channel protein Nach-like [Orussus abietinus]